MPVNFTGEFEIGGEAIVIFMCTDSPNLIGIRFTFSPLQFSPPQDNEHISYQVA